MYFDHHLQNLNKLNLPPEQYVVVASGALAIRGIRTAKDVDIVVSPELWSDLSGVHQIKVKKLPHKQFQYIDLPFDVEVLGPGATYQNSSVVPLQHIFERAEKIDSVYFMDLEQLREVKRVLGRKVDLQDVNLIDNYLQEVS